ncbi:hypothetical protein Tco_0264852, partial [Tanacetum coccineum]
SEIRDLDEISPRLTAHMMKRNEKNIGQHDNQKAVVVAEWETVGNQVELEAHYMYIAKIQMVIPAADEDTGPAYDTKPLEKVHSNDDYNVFANEQEQSEQHESINDTYVMEKDDSNVTHATSDICNKGRC